MNLLDFGYELEFTESKRTGKMVRLKLFTPIGIL